MVTLIEQAIPGYYRVVKAKCDVSGLRAFIAVHNVNLGVALGGCRVLEYPDADTQLADTLNLARGMTYKSALAGNKLGGGKSTILGPLTDQKLEAFGEALNLLNKDEVMYIAAADVGTNSEVLAKVANVTEFVNYKGQDCSIATAHGVFHAMKGACRFLGTDLRDQEVAISGYGKVGRRLTNLLLNNNTMTMVGDIIPPFKRNGYGAVDGLIPNRLGYIDYRLAHTKGTIYSPCALGGTVNRESITSMPSGHIICGAANNQLEDLAVQPLLKEKSITYVPDFVANAGGVIITEEQNKEMVDLDWNDYKVLPRLENIGNTVFDILERSKAERSYPTVIANKMAEEIFNA